MLNSAQIVSDLSGSNQEDADVHSASDEYAARFSGDVGRWMLDIQEQTTLKMLNSDIISVLDVGGGHGQIALPLMEAHKSVTVLGSSSKCSERLDSYIKNGMISFSVGNLIEIPFANRSFDCVVSFRFISHCTEWRRLISELCRVADRCVVIDYPTWISFNILSPLLFKLKRRVEGNTRTFEVFTYRQIRNEFRKNGFDCEQLKKQFFFPMAVHRLLKNKSFSNILEKFAKYTGLTYFFGSPCIAKMVRL